MASPLRWLSDGLCLWDLGFACGEMTNVLPRSTSSEEAGAKAFGGPTATAHGRTGADTVARSDDTQTRDRPCCAKVFNAAFSKIMEHGGFVVADLALTQIMGHGALDVPDPALTQMMGQGAIYVANSPSMPMAQPQCRPSRVHGARQIFEQTQCIFNPVDNLFLTATSVRKEKDGLSFFVFACLLCATSSLPLFVPPATSCYLLCCCLPPLSGCGVMCARHVWHTVAWYAVKPSASGQSLQHSLSDTSVECCFDVRHAAYALCGLEVLGALCGVWSVEVLRALSGVEVSCSLCAPHSALNSLDCMHQQAGR